MEDRGHKLNGCCRDINIAVLGAKHVGKSAMIVRFLTGRFIGDYDSEMEAVFSTHVPIDGKQCTVNIMDTAGYVPDQELKEDLVMWADGFILVFSLTDTHSFQVVEELITELRKIREDERIPILVAANKSDLVHLRTVNSAEAETSVSDQGMFISASEEPESVKNAFLKLCKQIRCVSKKREKLSWTLQRPAVAAKLQIRQSLKNLAEKKLWRSRTSTF
ncbi:unnamed protein product [Candidula unifasciata]|uniref:small monomeric GTPase n=1 Tax=Candidula unifasciata TaxID=100452 RepID=A0A8S3ZLM5_9EUPU|nr:unnamed protein product [Candidula unifasciata]